MPVIPSMSQRHFTYIAEVIKTCPLSVVCW
jgi:hypothetical protein